MKSIVARDVFSCAICGAAQKKKKSRSRLNALRDRSIPAVFGGGARQSVGRQAADCNGATKKKTMMKRRKYPGTRYRPGANTFPPGCLLCYILANGWPFKTRRCHFRAP